MFRIDDEYIDGYARLCGKAATLVYLCLCRHANSLTQECFPSIETMAEKLDVHRCTVIRGVKKLKEWNIISITREKFGERGRPHNVYILIDKSVWRPKPQLGSKSEHIWVAKKYPSSVAPSDSKDSNYKDTNYECSTPDAQSSPQHISELMKRFEKPRGGRGFA